MEKYIKLNGQKIIEIRPLLSEDVDEKVLETFEEEFIRAIVPEELSDIQIMQNYLYVNEKFVETDQIKNKIILQQELTTIKEWLVANDWIPNKIITGEWESNDSRWLAYLNERQTKRTRQDEIKKILGV